MIESRYKIEYELPYKDEKKSSPFKVLWYLLLIPLVLVAVTAITYDFSIKNITRDSTALLEKAKIHIFNLGEQQKFTRVENPSNKIIEKILTPKLKKSIAVENKPVIAKQDVITKLNNKADKKIISELAAKQELQLKQIQEQISKNTMLMQNLNSLSSELVLEKTRNDSLNSKLTEQEKDRLDLEEQLNHMLAESSTNEIVLEDISELKVETTEPIVQSTQALVKSNDTKVVEPTKIKKIESKKIVEIVLEKTIELTDTKTTEIKKAEDTEAVNINQLSTEKVEKQKSETDKIIETMSSINTDDNQATKESEIITTIKNTDTKPFFTDSKEEEKPIEREKNINFELGITNSNENKTEQNLIYTQISEVQKAEVISENLDKVVVAAKTESIEDKKKLADSTLEIESKPKTIAPVEAPKTTSPVDAIIAAMESSQANTSATDNQDVDTELEKDIKQQLVEQGDLSIDN